MSSRLTLKLALLTLSIAMCSVASAAPPPTVQNAICRPIFRADGQTFSAGTAFVLDLPTPSPRTLLVSAIHLFGPAGGLDKDIPAAELAQRASVVECQALGLDETWHAGRALTIPGARPMESGFLKDASAFVFDTAAVGIHPVHLKLATMPPKVDDSVWLLAQVLDGAPNTQLLHHAVVRLSKDDALQYEYDNASLSIQATSGAPVVNADGDVVGINLGGGTLHGKLIGIGDSLTSVRSMLDSAK